ncbi:multiple C2 and transmembrane domain-containing protein isoform X1 [Osmia bicornis bicornis]|uniref:multiple C2 and transmembrane domain-containing protein isoform X1 n=1 Tax=Osmia bicornis bicornis TaxID=1437191 RepID=UPI0010FA5E8B|nr:multiple C2 and transmembrane domain-containing protein isoform X1 [Osmia bicornis bicornis]
MKKSEAEPSRPQRHQKPSGTANEHHKDPIKEPDNHPSTEDDVKSLEQECPMIPRSGSGSWKKTSDIAAEETSTDSDHSTKSLKLTKISEESHENKWKKFWEHHRDRFKHKAEEELSKRSFDEVTAEVDAIFRRAIRSMRSDRSEYRRGSNIDLDEASVEKTLSEEAQCSRRAGLNARFEENKLPEILNDSGTIEKKSEEEIETVRGTDEEKEKDTLRLLDVSERNFLVELTDEEKGSQEIRGDPSSRRWSSLENLRANMDDAREKSSGTRIEGLSIEKPVRIKEKKTMGLLRSSLEKKMGSVERMLEDHMEKIIEGNVENRLWLLPIESWIVERCKHSVSHGVRQDSIDVDSKIEEKKSKSGEESFEFKYVAAEHDDEEPKIESRLEQTKKAEVKVEDAKHHDLFDKLKDNVKEKMEDIHRYFQRTNRLADVNRRLKSQIWSSVVTIVLVEAKNLLPMDIDGLSDPYVKFRLGTEKYKSKVVHKTLNPVWLEQFDLHLYEDPYLGQELEVTVWDRDKSHQDDLMGRTVIDLATLERETTHRLWRDLEDGSGSIFLLLTISGTTASETISDLAAHEETPREREQLYHRYSLRNSLQRLRDVGHLTVKVFRAQGLAAADLGGKSDPFCVLELVNARLQTQTEYKTLAPNWQKIFTFNVKDINSVLEVTVYDEDRDHKVEFLGKVAIPLLKIRNGEKRWYALKDKKLRGRAKGNSPQILLEMNVVWNVVRGCVQTLNPKEKKYMEPEIKFKRQVFLRNVLRLKAIIVIVIDIGKYVQSCWEWESKMRSIVAFVFFILGCYYFEPYMFPGAALLILLRYYLLYGDGSGLNQWISGQVSAITGTPLSHHTSSHYHDEIDEGATTPGDDDDDDDDKDKEEKKSLKERLQAIQEVTQTVQNSIGYIASLCERVKNLFNFTVPYLSYVTMLLTILGVAVLYFIPLRYLILVWGINKFSRKIFRPHSVPNNEVLDLISRVPDDEELLNYRELKPLPTADCERASTSGSPGPSNLTRREQRKRQKAA